MRLCTPWRWLCIPHAASFLPPFGRTCHLSRNNSLFTHTVRYISSSGIPKSETVESAIHRLHTQLLTESGPSPISTYLYYFSCFTKLPTCFIRFTWLLGRAETNAQAEELFYLAQENGYGGEVAVYNAKMSYHLAHKSYDFLFETRGIINHFMNI